MCPRTSLPRARQVCVCSEGSEWTPTLTTRHAAPKPTKPHPTPQPTASAEYEYEEYEYENFEPFEAEKTGRRRTQEGMQQGTRLRHT